MTVRVQGLRELRRFVADAPAVLERKVLRGAMRAGATVIADEAKVGAPKEDGDLAESITVRVTASERKVQASVDVDDFKAIWAEQGTAPHMILALPDEGLSARQANKRLQRGTLTINGKPVGEEVHHPGAAPHPFLLPAADAKEAEAVAAAQAHLDAHAAAALNSGVASPGSQLDDA